MPDTALSEVRPAISGVAVRISANRLSASITLAPRPEGEPAVTLEELKRALELAGVTFGIDSARLAALTRNPEYGEPVLIARGKKPEAGADATAKCHYRVSPEHCPHIDEHGRLDYHNLSYVENVRAGTVLVTKTPATPGRGGRGVDGSELAAQPGRDIRLEPGENTQLSDDGLKLIARQDGVSVVVGGIVHIKDVLLVDHDLDFRCGNIDCVKSVKINGDVLSGFTIKAAGNVEVCGTVGDSTIIAQGNILVKGGFFGSGRGLLSAGGDVVVKFADGQAIKAGNDVIAGGELINCHIEAGNRVVTGGQADVIRGGEIVVGREVVTRQLGGQYRTPTTVILVTESSDCRRHSEVQPELERLSFCTDLALNRLRELRARGPAKGNWPRRPSHRLTNLLQSYLKRALPLLESLTTEAERAREHSAAIAAASVTVTEKAFPGVTVSFAPDTLQLKQELGKCRIWSDGTHIHVTEASAQAQDVIP